eukprot:SAG11_NODE_102_length_16709_cov_31.066093_7_plen_103_part_00
MPFFNRSRRFPVRSATVLAASSNGSSEFSGYIVPRSGGQQAGGLLRRAIALVGSGAKALRYFMFGPGKRRGPNAVGSLSMLIIYVRRVRRVHESLKLLLRER